MVAYVVRTTIAAHIRILDLNSEQTSYYCTQLLGCTNGSGEPGQYVVSGHVINDGGNTSNVIQLVLIITDNQTGVILYPTTPIWLRMRKAHFLNNLTQISGIFDTLCAGSVVETSLILKRVRSFDNGILACRRVCLYLKPVLVVVGTSDDRGR
jgi:hypothetical protein